MLSSLVIHTWPLFGTALTFWICFRVILPLLEKSAAKHPQSWLALLLRQRIFHLIPYFVTLLVFAPLQFADATTNAMLTRILAICFLIWIFVFFQRVLSTGEEIYNRHPISRDRPIKTYLQVLSLVFGLFTALLAIGVVLQQSLVTLISGLGALTAVGMLIFKDPIVGFASGVQLMANQMIRLGDWIEMPDYKADGEVIELSMTTVKVRNWDLTITTIPVQAMTSGSFRNWRNMEEMGGRQIKRSLIFDLHSVAFCSDAQLAHLQQFKLLQTYLGERQEEIRLDNAERGFNETLLGGRRLTNIGVFRRYAQNYLCQHPKIHQDMTVLARLLQVNENGLPLELYAFSRITNLNDYENLQSDIFEHLIAILPEFGLRLNQRS